MLLMERKMNSMYESIPRKGRKVDEEVIQTGEKQLSWDVNADGSAVAIVRDSRSSTATEGDDNPYEFDWGDIYLYYYGYFEPIAQKSFSVQYGGKASAVTARWYISRMVMLKPGPERCI